MKIKRILASMLSIAISFQLCGVVTFADTDTTQSDFTATAEMLGGDLVVSIPDEILLVKDEDNFVGTGTVTAKGTTKPNVVLYVSTNPTITYANQSKTDITVDANVTFGTDCTASWTASQLRDNITADEKLGYEVTATVPFSDVKYIGEYKTNILFNIELITSASALTYYMGYDYSDGSTVDYANESNIAYDILPQTNTVAELKEFSTNKDVLVAKGYDKVIESSDSKLVIPSYIDDVDVVGVSFDTFFADENISTYVTEIEVPSSVTGIELTDTTSSQSTTIITCENIRTSVNLSKQIPSTAKIRFKFEVNGEKDFTEFFTYSYMSDFDGYEIRGFSEYGYEQLASYGSDATVELIFPLTYNGKSVVGMQDYYGDFVDSLNADNMPNQKWIFTDSYKYCCGLWSNSTFDEDNPCTKLVDIKFNEGLERISNEAFEYCTALTSISIPSTVTEICSGAFANCTSLSEVTIAEGCSAYLSDSAFAETNISSITLPSTITTIHGCAFGDQNYSDIAIEKIVWNLNHEDADIDLFSDGLYGVCIFYNDGVYFGAGEDAVKAIATTEDGITGVISTDIPDKAFYNSYSERIAYKNLIISEGVTSIGSDAFYKASIPNIVLPSTLTTIGDEAFCRLTTNKMDLRNIASIGDGVLICCNIDTVILNSTTIVNDALREASIKNLYINYNGGTLDSYSTNGLNVENIYFSGTEEDWITFIGTKSNNALTVDMDNVTFNATMPD